MQSYIDISNTKLVKLLFSNSISQQCLIDYKHRDLMTGFFFYVFSYKKSRMTVPKAIIIQILDIGNWQ